MDIKKIAYEKYKLDWMLHHGYTLTDLMNELESLRDDTDPINLLFIFWEEEYGFGSEIWVCYQEFLDNEYLDEGYMKQLLTWEEYEKYQEDLK